MSPRDPFENAETVLEVEDLVKHFPISQGVVFQRQVGAVKAVDCLLYTSDAADE